MPGLDGVQVVAVGDGRVAQVLATLLADQGADVVVAGASSRDWGVARGVVRVSEPDALAVLVARADVVLDLGERPLDGPRPPGSVWCRVHAGHLPLQEGVVAAATGLHEPPVGLQPRAHDVPVATLVGCAWAATGIVAALLARRRDGHGQRVTVDLREAALAATELLALFTDDPPRAFQPLQWVASPFVNLHPCRTGHLFVHLGLPHHLARFLAGLGDEGDELRGVLSEQTRKDPGAMGGVREAVRATRALRRLLATDDAEAWEARFPRLCLAAVRTPEEWIGSEEARAAGHVVDVEGRRMPGAAVQTPGTAVRPSRDASLAEILDRWVEPVTPWGNDPRPPLADVRVLDFTAVIAGPVAGRTLAELGADVLRIDDPWFRPAWADGFHALFDRGKRSAWLDLQVPAEREVLERVVADLDPQLVLQNFRPGVAERLGLTAYADHVVSLSAFGTEGAWGRRPGWEQTVQAVAGIQSRYGGDAPELFPVPVHDLVTGLFGAYGALVTLFGGGGAHASLARTATWMLAHHTCGDGPADGAWEKRDDGWWFVAGDVAVPRTRPAAARAASARVRREHRDDLGTFTRIDAPLVLSHTPVVEGASRPRGWATQEVTDGQRPPATREVPGRRRWWAGRIRWGLGVAAVRLLP